MSVITARQPTGHRRPHGPFDQFHFGHFWDDAKRNISKGRYAFKPIEVHIVIFFVALFVTLLLLCTLLAAPGAIDEMTEHTLSHPMQQTFVSWLVSVVRDSVNLFRFSLHW